jgi:hypothetical protein
MGVRTWDLGDYFWSKKNKKYGYLGKYWDRSPYRDEVWVNCAEDAVFYYLHGHAIAVWRFKEGKLEVSDCGYATQTTYSRLDMILSEIDFHAFRHYGLGFIKDCKKGLYYPMLGRREIDLNTRIVTNGDGGMAYVLDSDTFWLAEDLYHTLRRYGVLFSSIVSGNIRLTEEEERRLRRRTRERIADLTLRLIFLRESFSRWGSLSNWARIIAECFWKGRNVKLERADRPGLPSERVVVYFGGSKDIYDAWYFVDGREKASLFRERGVLHVFHDDREIRRVTYSRLDRILRPLGFSVVLKPYAGFLVDQKRKLYYMLSYLWHIKIDVEKKAVASVAGGVPPRYLPPTVYTLDAECYRLVTRLYESASKRLRPPRFYFMGLLRGKLSKEVYEELDEEEKDMLADFMLRRELRRMEA